MAEEAEGRKRLSARGLDFLENWILKNVMPADHAGGHLRAITLAQQCVADAAAQGILIHDKVPGRLSITGTILDVMVHLAEPGTPGD